MDHGLMHVRRGPEPLDGKLEDVKPETTDAMPDVRDDVVEDDVMRNGPDARDEKIQDGLTEDGPGDLDVESEDEMLGPCGVDDVTKKVVKDVPCVRKECADVVRTVEDGTNGIWSQAEKDDGETQPSI